MQVFKDILEGFGIVLGVGILNLLLILAVIRNWFGTIVKNDDDDPDPNSGGMFN